MLRFCLICAVLFGAAIAASPQSSSQRQQRVPSKQTLPTTVPDPPAEPIPAEDPQEVLKTDTDLVTVPVIAASSQGNYIPDLTREEFSISEDGVKQDVAFFAAVNAPFHVVLLLDTSASTQEKLGLIRRAAVAFVEQLQPGDRVKVISFDDRVRELNEFTNDRAALNRAIYQTAAGQGTKLYDAVELALSSMRRIEGRRAIVLFSDGVDWHSDNATFDGTLHWLDEEGIIVYPIRYETRAETERIARQQADDQMPQLPTIDVVRNPPSGTTAPTFPSEDPDAVPTSGQRRTTGPLGLPSASEILRRRRESERDRDRRQGDRYPSPGGLPPSAEPGRPGDDQTFPGPISRGSRRPPDDSISAMLDQLYLKADSYLGALAEKTGGRLVRADTLASLPDAFAKIAAALRTQYTIGYYPTNKDRDGKYRKIKVTSTRKNVAVRARPGYRAPGGG